MDLNFRATSSSLSMVVILAVAPTAAGVGKIGTQGSHLQMVDIPILMCKDAQVEAEYFYGSSSNTETLYGRKYLDLFSASDSYYGRYPTTYVHAYGANCASFDAEPYC